MGTPSGGEQVRQEVLQGLREFHESQAFLHSFLLYGAMRGVEGLGEARDRPDQSRLTRGMGEGEEGQAGHSGPRDELELMADVIGVSTTRGSA